MKILILSDIHDQKISLQKILEKTADSKLDACFVSGDLTNFGSKQDLYEIVHIITEMIPKIYFVLGNCDPRIENFDMNDGIFYVEDAVYRCGNFIVLGYGFSNPEINFSLLDKLRKQNSKVCLITHVPPYQTAVDLVSLKKHVGSLSVRSTIEKYTNIFLNVCGHIHESRAIDSLNDTLIINSGPVNTGHYAIIEISDDLRINCVLHSIYE